MGEDIDGEAANGRSGWAVSLSLDGGRVAIGAYALNQETGHVRVYEFQSGNWAQLGSDIDGEAQWDRFGSSVSMSSDGSRGKVYFVVLHDLSCFYVLCSLLSGYRGTLQ